MGIFEQTILCLFFSYGIQIDAESLENIALHKPTVQDGELHYPTNNELWSAEHAVDGKKVCPNNADYIHYSGTAEKEEPWWQVDLGKVFSISKINVYGRPTQKPFQLHGFIVHLSIVNHTTSTNHVYNNSDIPYGNGSFIDILGGKIYTARYITIVLPMPGSGRDYDGTLVLCEVEIYGKRLPKTVNIAHIAKVSRSTVLTWGGNNYSEINVIDGNPASDPDNCDCCWHSDNEHNPWLELVLPYSAPVITITVIGRTDSGKSDATKILSGLNIKVDNRMIPDDWVLYNTADNAVTIYPQPTAAKSIKFTRPGTGGQWFLIICEVYINTTGCNNGYYGDNCNFTCSINCKPGSPKCSTMSGVCTYGCTAGFNGSHCTQPCVSGRYGENCANHCHHCLSGTSCNTVTGNCPSGCDPGFKGDKCDTSCGNGHYGYNCNLPCNKNCKQGSQTCNAVTGVCTNGCKAGFNGSHCTQPCGSGSYGENCANTCGHCVSGLSCNGETGNCSNGCDLGFKGSKCKTRCSNGHYGYNCNSTCGSNCNVGSQTCNKESGVCTNGCNAGFNGSYCTQACSSGHYGENCKNMCGHCSFGTFCNGTNGICSAGCDPGFMGNKCDIMCPNGSYGKNCEHHCHCFNNATCTKTNGSCPGRCDIMWSGPYCSEDKNLISRIEAKTRQSGTFLNNTDYNASKAIDGVEDYLVDSCKCCSVARASHTSSSSWWMIDLGRQYLIGAVEIFGRSDGIASNQLRSAYIYAGNDSLMANGTFGDMIYTVPKPSATVYSFLKQLNTSLIAKKFLVLLNEDTLTICEFKLLEKECHVSTYGNGCSRRCNCLNDTKCDSVTGHCNVGECKPGWQGDACDKVCNDRKFGQGCIVTCNCLNSTLCDPVNGTCEIQECDPGWYGPSCSDPCMTPTFGFQCNKTCHCINGSTCDHITGHCELSGCDPGWMGDACSYECYSRHFGQNCNQTCHCINGTHCDNVNGRCEMQFCDPGWTGTSCDTKCTVATFGQGCNYSCHCFNETACNHINGTCLIGECDPGWIGDACDAECNVGTFGPGCNYSCHCLNETACNHINGTCLVGECDPGWTGDACDAECIVGTFGPGCYYSCHCLNETVCNHISGTCLVGECDPGWTGDACDAECTVGTFGPGCNYSCHCLNDTACNHINGTCLVGECDPGWTGDACVADCPHDKYGKGCNSTCHCDDNSHCDRRNGSCPCAVDYTGPACQIHISQSSHGKDSSAASIAGGVSAAVVLTALCVIIGFIIIKRKRAVKETSGKQSQFSNLDKALENKSKKPPTSHLRAHENRSFEADGEEETSMNVPGGGDYYSFGDQFMGIRIHELWDYIHEKMENKCEKLYAEFRTLPQGLVHAYASADNLANRGKNRYREMYAYDHSRVVLDDVEDGKNTDYINACYIDGYEKVRKFVASQGPTKQMIADFWRMVWQLKSDKIVMLTNLVEMGTTKCMQYWPKEDEEDECTYGNVVVKLLGTKKYLDYNIRNLEIRKGDETPRRIRQFHFKSWPDKDVPDSTWCLVNFWRAVDTNAPSKAGPIVVHCSAGVGRTGTFIGLDNMVNQARQEGCVRPLQMIQTLRRQRVNMVQTSEQYVYLHEAVADALLFGTHIVWTKQFEDMLTFMFQKEKGDTRTRLQIQFELIEKSMENSSPDDAASPEYSNVETLMSESDAYRPKLKNRGSKFVQQLRAIYVPNYKGKSTFLVSMSPDQGTMEEFWSLVDDSNIKTIIMLTEPSTTCYRASCELGSCANNGNKFSVNKIEEKIRKGYTERTFTFKESAREEEESLTTVKQFEYTAWKDGYPVPGDTGSLLDLIASVQRWQPHLSESQPILIHCGDGCSRSGIVCVLLNELQRMKYEGGHVNIVESVKMMKKRQSHLISNFEQYKFCFDLVMAHIKLSEVYQNL